MVLHNYDSNAILAAPLKNKSAAKKIKATTTLHLYLKSQGLTPKMHIMDNECPDNVKEYLQANTIDVQLVQPHVLRTNAAKKVISTFKDHFISGLCSVDPSLPMHLWCRLPPLATTTLNLKRPSLMNPKLSAEDTLNGAFDYNKTPLAPPGTKTPVHETPNQRRTWAAHGVDGWYLGAAPEHYHCHRTYITNTRKERIARIVKFLPHDHNMPTISSADAATMAAQDLLHALQNPVPTTTYANVCT